MSQISGDMARICANVIQHLGLINPEQNPEFRSTPTGMLDALINARQQSSSSIFSDVDQGNGHTRDVRINYKQRGLESDIVEGVADCDEGVYNEPLEIIYRPNTVLKTPAIVVPEERIRPYCAYWSEKVNISASERINTLAGAITSMDIFRELAMDIMQAIIVLRQKWDKELLTQALAVRGDLPTFSGATANGSGFYEATVINADGSVRFSGVNQIMNWFQDASTKGTPYMVGAGNLRNTVNALASACCNDGGIDMNLVNQAFKAFYYYDPFVNDQLGNANRVIAWQPGSLVMPTINYYKGSFAAGLANVYNFTMADPQNPLIQYDVQLREVGCGTGRGLSVVVSTPHFDLLSDPFDLYQVGDDFEGFTGVIGVEALASA